MENLVKQKTRFKKGPIDILLPFGEFVNLESEKIKKFDDYYRSNIFSLFLIYLKSCNDSILELKLFDIVLIFM